MHKIVLVLLFTVGVSHAKDSRYDTSFINKSPFYKKEAKILSKFFQENYLVHKEKVRIGLIGNSRLKSIGSSLVKETKSGLKENPLFLIDWPSERNLILKYVKEVEKEKRK